MRNLIFRKIEELQKRTPSLNKFFNFSMEDLQDNPGLCFVQIEEYLEKHKDKIEDFEFHTWTDENSFKTVLMLKMFLTKEYADHLYSNNLFDSFLPSSSEADILRERIQNIFFKYQWEFAEEDIRLEVKTQLEYIIKGQGIRIDDRTTNDNIDHGLLNFIVVKGDSEMTLTEYIDYIKSKKRFEE